MTKSTLLAFLLGLVVAACGENPDERQADQCLRRELFYKCLETVPKGPTHTAGSNDWDEVISECSTTSYYLSVRPKRLITEQCL